MFYLYWTLFFLKNFLNYEKINERIQALKRHKLIPPSPLSSPRSQDIAVAFFIPKSIYALSLNKIAWYTFLLFGIIPLLPVPYLLFIMSIKSH